MNQEIYKNRLRHARLFTSIFCFIKDLGPLNDVGEFEISYMDIYPQDFKLKKWKITLQRRITLIFIFESKCWEIFV